MYMRKSIALAGCVWATTLPMLTVAQEYPSRLIQFVVPATPGTVMDTLARLLGAKMAQRWNVPVVVDNKIGAGGIIGAQAVAKADPDGYTLLCVGSSFETIAASNPKLPFDPIKSFVRVSLLGNTVMTLVVSNGFQANTVQEFIEQARKRPGMFNYASPGIGSMQHLAMELLKQEANVNVVHVPYKGSSGVLSDIIAGHVQASVVTLPSATPLVQGGKIRMLAVMGRERPPTLPAVPTMVEVGLGKVVVAVWYGVMAPAGTPATVVRKINAELDALLALQEVREVMGKQGVTAAGGKPEVFDAVVRDGIALWKQVITRGNIVVE